MCSASGGIDKKKGAIWMRTLCLLVFLILLTLGLTACQPATGNGPSNGGNGNPSIEITQPEDGTTVSPGSVVVIRWSNENLPPGSQVKLRIFTLTEFFSVEADGEYIWDTSDTYGEYPLQVAVFSEDDSIIASDMVKVNVQ